MKSKKMLSFLLAALLVISLIPASMAEDEPAAEIQVTESASAEVTVVEAPAVALEAPAAASESVEVYESTQSGESQAESSTVEVAEGAEAGSEPLPDGVYDVQKEISELEPDGQGGFTETETSESEETLVTEEDCVVQKETAEGGGDVITVIDDDNKITETGGKEGCAHVLTETVVRSATCSECGIIEYKCTEEGCDYVKTVLTDKLAHTRGDTVKSVNCADVPYDVCTCSVCGASYNVPNGSDKVAHSLHNGVCTVCGYVEYTYGTVYDTSGTSTKKAAEYTFTGSTLTVSKGEDGTGELQDYKNDTELDSGDVLSVPDTELTPWSSFASQIKKLVVKSGITRIGDWAFGFLENLKSVIIEGADISIGDYAFAEDTSLKTVTFTSTKADVSYDNDSKLVAEGDEEDTGATAYYDDGNVTINYNCRNKKAGEQKKTELAGVSEHYGCYHNNAVKVYGYAPTESAFGLTDGLYCKDCKTWIVYQYKIYPNGKAVTGNYKFTEFKDWKEVPDTLSNISSYNTIEKLSTLKKDFRTQLNDAMVDTYGSKLANENFKIYSVEMLKNYQTTTPDPHILNIPYPDGTNPESNDFVVVQMNKDGKFEQLDILKTNKGIQIETETLTPLAIAYK